MRLIRLLTLYLALLAGANTAAADTADTATLEALREGDMKKLVFHSDPQPVSEAAFELADGAGTATLADYRGRYVLLNFWATWCAPCEREMPSLGALQTSRGGDAFKVITISVDEPEDRDYAEQRLRELSGGVLDFYAIGDGPEGWNVVYDSGAGGGFPTTILYGKDGLKVAKIEGDTDWASYEAVALVDLIKSQ